MMIADFCGYETTEACHEALKAKFLGEEIDQYGLKHVKSTTGLDTTEFIEAYTEPIKRWAAEFLGLPIPDPNQVEWDDDGRARFE